MDFALTEDQQSLRDLARQILSEGATHDRLKALESAGWSVFDRELWQRLADAGITGIAVPETQGGGGLGFLELATVFEEVGRTVAPVPAVPTLVTAYALARHGAGQQVLAGVAGGTTILTTAFEGEVLATREDDGWVLEGETPFVPFGAEADVVVVPARFGTGPVAALVRRGTPGLTVTELHHTHPQPEALLTCTAARVEQADVIEDADDLIDDLRRHTTA